PRKPVCPGSEVLPTNAVVERQAIVQLPTILGIDTREVVAVVEQLGATLSKTGQVAHLEVGKGIHILAEHARTELSVLVTDVGYVELTEFDVAAEGEVVLA